LRTAVPTSVSPPDTGLTVPEVPVTAWPPIVAVATTAMSPWTVGAPGMEKVPSGSVVPLGPRVKEGALAAGRSDDPRLPSRTVTAAPPTGLPPTSTTLPTTVVKGSGTTFNTTSAAVPMPPATSTAWALKVTLETPVGTVKVKEYGENLAVAVWTPSTKRSTSFTIVVGAVTSTRTLTLDPATTVEPAAGAEMTTVGASRAIVPTSVAPPGTGGTAADWPTRRSLPTV